MGELLHKGGDMKKGRSSFLAFFFILALSVLACNLSGTEQANNSLSIVITNPSESISIPVGELLEVTTSSFSDIGIVSVKLLVNGQQVALNAPEEMSPTFVITQSWEPVITGTFQISAAVEDIDGQTVQSDIISVTVTGQTNQPLPSPTETTHPEQSPIETSSPPTSTPENNQADPTSTSFILFGITLAVPPIEVMPIEGTPFNFMITMPYQIGVIPLQSPSVYFQQNILPIAPGQSNQITVSCNSGDLATSIGYLVTSSWQVRITQSSGSNESWQVTAHNSSSSDQAATVVVTCLKNSGGTTEIIRSSELIQPDIEQDISAVCPAGTVIAGGGWETNNPDIMVRQSAPSGNGWVIRVLHSEDSVQQVTAIAVCLSGTNASAETYMEYVSVPPKKTKEINVFCPSGSLISGGGYLQEFEQNANGPIYTAAEDEILYGWQGIGKNPAAQTTFKIYVYANCLRFP